MSNVHLINKPDNDTGVNDVFQIKNLSFQARAFLALLFEQPADFTFNQREFADKFDIGYKVLKGIIRELKENGYLSIEGSSRNPEYVFNVNFESKTNSDFETKSNSKRVIESKTNSNFETKSNSKSVIESKTNSNFETKSNSKSMIESKTNSKISKLNNKELVSLNILNNKSLEGEGEKEIITRDHEASSSESRTKKSSSPSPLPFDFEILKNGDVRSVYDCLSQYKPAFQKFVTQLLTAFQRKKSFDAIAFPKSDSEIVDFIRDFNRKVWNKHKHDEPKRNLEAWLNYLEYLLSEKCEYWVLPGQITLSKLIRFSDPQRNHWDGAQKSGFYTKKREDYERKLREKRELEKQLRDVNRKASPEEKKERLKLISDLENSIRKRKNANSAKNSPAKQVENE